MHHFLLFEKCLIKRNFIRNKINYWTSFKKSVRWQKYGWKWYYSISSEVPQCHLTVTCGYCNRTSSFIKTVIFFIVYSITVMLSVISLHRSSVAALCFVWVSELLPDASDIRLSLLLRGKELDDGPAGRCWNPIEMSGLDSAEGI